MNWLTQKQVNAAAKESEPVAIACSDLHWTQILTATKREIREIKNWYFLPCSGYCALCVRHLVWEGRTDCDNCSLGKIEWCIGSDSAWNRASDAFNEYMDGNITCCQFRKRAQPMLDLIRSLK